MYVCSFPLIHQRKSSASCHNCVSQNIIVSNAKAFRQQFPRNIFTGFSKLIKSRKYCCDQSSCNMLTPTKTEKEAKPDSANN